MADGRYMLVYSNGGQVFFPDPKFSDGGIYKIRSGLTDYRVYNGASVIQFAVHYDDSVQKQNRYDTLYLESEPNDDLPLVVSAAEKNIRWEPLYSIVDLDGRYINIRLSAVVSYSGTQIDMDPIDVKLVVASMPRAYRRSSYPSYASAVSMEPERGSDDQVHSWKTYHMSNKVIQHNKHVWTLDDFGAVRATKHYEHYVRLGRSVNVYKVAMFEAPDFLPSGKAEMVYKTRDIPFLVVPIGTMPETAAGTNARLELSTNSEHVHISSFTTEHGNKYSYDTQVKVTTEYETKVKVTNNTDSKIRVRLRHFVARTLEPSEDGSSDEYGLYKDIIVKANKTEQKTWRVQFSAE